MYIWGRYHIYSIIILYITYVIKTTFSKNVLSISFNRVGTWRTHSTWTPSTAFWSAANILTSSPTTNSMVSFRPSVQRWSASTRRWAVSIIWSSLCRGSRRICISWSVCRLLIICLGLLRGMWMREIRFEREDGCIGVEDSSEQELCMCAFVFVESVWKGGWGFGLEIYTLCVFLHIQRSRFQEFDGWVSVAKIFV